MEYYRPALKTNCSSLQIAHSYLEGRIGEDECFIPQEGKFASKKLTMAQVLLNDPVLREAVGNFKPSSVAEKNNSFACRFALFRSIVLRGDNAWEPILVENDRQKEENTRLKQKLFVVSEKCNRVQHRNQKLLSVCRNHHQVLRHCAEIFSVMQSSAAPQSQEYSRCLNAGNVLHNFMETIEKKSQENFNTVTQDEIEKEVEEIQAIEDFRKSWEREQSDKIDQLQAEIDQYQAEALQQIEKDRTTFESETAGIRKKIEREFQDDREKIAKQKTENEAKLFRERHVFEVEKKHHEDDLIKQSDSCCQKILELQKNAQKAIQASADELSEQLALQGKLSQKIKSAVKREFNSESDKNIYTGKRISYDQRCSVAAHSGGDIPPSSVYAVWDDSLSMQCPRGAAVSRFGAHFFNDTSKINIPLNSYFEYSISCENQRVRWSWIFAAIIISIILLVNGLAVLLFLPLILFLIGVSWKKQDVRLIVNQQGAIVFPNANKVSLENFCQALKKMGEQCHFEPKELESLNQIILPEFSFIPGKENKE